jgi:hypothetical protein
MPEMNSIFVAGAMVLAALLGDNHTHATALAAAVGWMMGLDEDRLANAISLATVDNIPLGIDHWEGPLSMSKSNHDAALCRSGIFAAMQAKAGLTGPAEVFEGPKGLMDVITGRFDLRIPANVINDSGGYPTLPGHLAIRANASRPLSISVGPSTAPVRICFQWFLRFLNSAKWTTSSRSTWKWTDGATGTAPARWIR